MFNEGFLESADFVESLKVSAVPEFHAYHTAWMAAKASGETIYFTC